MRRFLSICIIIAAAILTACNRSSGNEAPAEPTPTPGPVTGSNIYVEYSVENNAVTIIRYIGSNTEYEVPAEIDGAPVTAIGDGAFRDCVRLVSVALPDSVQRIGEYAFFGCSSLADIRIPEAIAEIGPFAFIATPWFDNLADEFTIINDILIKCNSAE
ncbi:MAG: leucine-rich repeat domain-containing protein, partial [Clostridiales bacterium]|nr:leucine-rich repeat domain-containing protein [Clostridiales bacterium]